MVLLHVSDDIYLVKDYARVEYVEGRVVQGPGQNDVFEELESVSMMDFPLNGCIADRDGLVEAGCLVEKFTVVSFVAGEVRVICK